MENSTSGAKALIIGLFTARLKPCPDTNRSVVAGAGLVEVVKLGVLTRAKARHCRVGRSRGFENPLPRTEVRGWHRLVRSLAEI